MADKFKAFVNIGILLNSCVILYIDKVSVQCQFLCPDLSHQRCPFYITFDVSKDNSLPSFEQDFGDKVVGSFLQILNISRIDIGLW